MKQIEVQSIFLSKKINLIELHKSQHKRNRFGSKKIRVHRNQNFESIASLLTIFGNFSGYEYILSIGSYDDSLSYQDIKKVDVDLELIWIDYDRYLLTDSELTDFIAERITYLRNLSMAPILIIDSPDAVRVNFNISLKRAVKEIVGVYFFSLFEVARSIDECFFDNQRSDTFGTRISSVVIPRLAADLGLIYLPAIFRPRIKAIAIDLDNTIYAGVLGEDSIEGVSLSDGHKLLQEVLVNLGAQGILLAITSKNVEEDVYRLFNQRFDFPLRRKHLSGIRANWNRKDVNINSLANEFNISPNDFLLLDDNMAEIVAVATTYPSIDFLHCGDDPALTANQLRRYPGLLALSLTATDQKRSNDIIARQKRLVNKAGVSMNDYLSKMQTAIGLNIGAQEEFSRLCEVPHKTNQFNLALRRLKQVDVQRYLDLPDHQVVSFSLKDRLSNSGNVGAVYGRIYSEVLEVEELCISCRALGRGIEDFLITQALAAIIDNSDDTINTLRFSYRIGPRNQPALTWLKKYLSLEENIISVSGGKVEEPINSVDQSIADFNDKINTFSKLPINIYSQTSF
ncbi:HAD-IIIC family phosphatase [Endozoicomonas sp. 8E]|uniref:HAD-IIIC family phosphatase n=1 Tax=Endozoicomonas sp. 8E TaxID=3035692 RepID=UPI0029394B6C|nr:HAD-IIIC family phosphatase [Endozoicomonas sp. 8E]WOG26340.1 HAD-IIIC family phosphatase [Endozoicomonas sp. 8E]